MRIDSILIHNQPPVHQFEVSGLSSVVVIAGPNGIGKTRLMNAVITRLRNPEARNPNANVRIKATTNSEREAWNTDTLTTEDANHGRVLKQTLQGPQKRGNWKSGVLQFDSSRQFSQVQPMQWQWNFGDPTEENIGWDVTFNPFQARFQDTIHAIYKMLGHHRAEIARKAMAMQKDGHSSMPLDFPDPLTRFREAFHLLLGPKILADIDLNNPQIRYVQGNTTLSIDNLSSGEKESFNIVFDLLLRNPHDCIVFFDEPELHLHPELSFRLLKALQVIGLRNQFFFLTHSADIISSAIEHSVIFLAPRSPDANQAIPLGTADETSTALQELGQSLGIISLGRKIVLIEGTESSLDRDVYGAILQTAFPSLVLAPSGSRQTILGFSRIVEDVLSRTLWGLEFFMLADRDNSLPEEVLTDLESKSRGRLAFLPRLHLENYFLDEFLIADAFCDLAPPSDWRRNPSQVRDRLLALAKSLIPLAVNRWLGTRIRALVGEIDVTIKGNAHQTPEKFLSELIPRVEAEQSRLATHLRNSALEAEVQSRWLELSNALGSDEWKRIFPGKILFAQFASAAAIKPGFLKNAYMAAARRSATDPFMDIRTIFDRWA